MLPDLISPDSGVQSIFLIGFFAALIVAMVLGYWNRAMLMASLKRENQTLRNANASVEYVSDQRRQRLQYLETVVPPEKKNPQYGGGD